MLLLTLTSMTPSPCLSSRVVSQNVLQPLYHPVLCYTILGYTMLCYIIPYCTIPCSCMLYAVLPCLSARTRSCLDDLGFQLVQGAAVGYNLSSCTRVSLGDTAFQLVRGSVHVLQQPVDILPTSDCGVLAECAERWE